MRSRKIGEYILTGLAFWVVIGTAAQVQTGHGATAATATGGADRADIATGRLRAAAPDRGLRVIAAHAGKFRGR